MTILTGVVASSADSVIGPAPPPSGDITATDPLGLSVGQDVAWTINPAAPPPSGGRRWNPGHYIRLSGRPYDDPAAYWIKVKAQATADMNNSSNFIGVQLDIPWGQINPTGVIYDWTLVDEFVAHMATIGPNYKILWQPSWKSFTGKPTPTLEAPADLLNEVWQQNQGWWSNMHRSYVTDRWNLMVQAFAARYDTQPWYEAMMTTEVVPSWGGAPNGTPPDYTTAKYVTQFKRIMATMAASHAEANIFPQINFLSGFTEELIEYCWELGIGVGNPDAREVASWDIYEGVGAVRDYRFQIPNAATASFSSFGFSCQLRNSAQIIDFMQIHQTTHMIWVTTQSCESTTQIASSITNDPVINTACPIKYTSCAT